MFNINYTRMKSITKTLWKYYIDKSQMLLNYTTNFN